MRRPRAGIGAEMVPLALILAALAGSLGLIVAVHRRSAPRKATVPPMVVAAVPAVVEPPAPGPIPIAVPVPEPIEEPEPEQAPPPPPEDPTPKALAPLRAAEAEQRDEAARADRRAEALEKARRDAEAESARWKRREALARGQLDALDARARALENQMAGMAAGRDALARRRDVARAALDRARARPGSAILPHKGPNGTWRRPIAVECRNGQAILQPRGLAFGLLDLAEGFSPSSSPFVAAIAREAAHLQRGSSPDGSPVVPYIFFVIRPDGIRPYYEARSRLEALGITFGYELVDQETGVAFPDLDDTSTWDGSAPAPEPDGPAARDRPGFGPALDDEPKSRTAPRRSAPSGSRRGPDDPAGDFTWTLPRLGRFGESAVARGDEAGMRSPAAPGPGSAAAPGGPTLGPPGASAEVPGGPGGGPPGVPGPAGRSGLLPEVEPPHGPDPSPGPGGPHGGMGPATLDNQTGAMASADVGGGGQGGEVDPGVSFVWPPRPGAGQEGRAGRPPEAEEAEAEAAVSAVPSLPTAREVAALRDGSGRPGDARTPGNRPGAAPAASTPPGSGAGDRTTRRMTGPAGSGATSGDGPNTPPPAVGSPSGLGIGLPSLGPAGAPGPVRAGSPSPTDFVPPGTIVDRGFELVVACGPRGATVHPGGYRVTADALAAPDGLLLRQMKALVKDRRGDDPHLRLEPRVRFLVQPGGEATYRAAKGQVLMSGLGWPTTFQVVGPDPVSLLPTESW